MTSEETLGELVEKLSNGDCVVFIGAGLSTAVGLPGWTELIGSLSIELHAPDETSPLEIAQVYEKVYGRRRLEERICRALDITGKRPSDNHLLLCSLGTLRVEFVTTNYDNLIEETLREQAQKHKVVVSDKDLPGMSKELVTLIKFHGDKDQAGTMTITLNDYFTLDDRVPLILKTLTHFLSTRTFLFVGYSSRDIDLQHFQARVSSRLSSYARRSYAVVDTISEFEKLCLECRDVVSVDISDWGKKDTSLRLTAFLLELFKRIVLHRNRKTDIPKRVCTSDEAHTLVPAEMITDMKNGGRNLVGCIDFTTYVDATDSGQHNWQGSIDILPHSGNNSHNRNVKYYSREDHDRNIHEGLAFFL